MNDWYDAEQRAEKAHELFAQRKWVEALEELRAAVAINPYNSSWLFNMGVTLDELERYDEAIDAYRKVLEIEPNDIEALNRMGANLARVGRPREALRAFEQLQEVDPSFEPSYCNRIICYAELGDHEKAEEMFYLARLYKEDCPHCYYNMGCSLEARELHDKAIFCCQKVIDLDEHYPEVHLRLAEAYWAKSEHEAARRHYLIDLRQNPGNVDALLDLGNLLMELDRVDEAGEKFRHVLELAPDDASGHYYYAQWLMHKGRADRAIDEFQHTLQLDPTFAGAHLNLGRIYLRQNDAYRARRHLRSEMLLRTDDAKLLLDLANLLMDAGETRSAITCLRRLTRLQPDSADAWQNLAVAYFMRGRYDDGIASCRQALRCDSEHPMAMYNMALAHADLRQYDQALVWVRRALEKQPDDPSLQRLLLRLRVLKLRSRVLNILPLGWIRRKTQPRA